MSNNKDVEEKEIVKIFSAGSRTNYIFISNKKLIIKGYNYKREGIFSNKNAKIEHIFEIKDIENINFPDKVGYKFLEFDCFGAHYSFIIHKRKLEKIKLTIEELSKNILSKANKEKKIEQLKKKQQRENEQLRKDQQEKDERNKDKRMIIDLIKELLLELRDGDEVLLSKAIEIIRKEGEYSFLTDGFIEEALKQVANKSPVFEYVRLKECIRTKGSSIETLGVELDTIFEDWLSDIEDGKELCMICMKPVTGEKIIGTCVFCDNKAHLDHFKEWVNQKAVCPACKETLKQEDIIEVTQKNII